MSQQLWTYPGGLVLDDHKELSTKHPLTRAPLPKQVILPLQQHIGAPPQVLVEVGDKVLKGQVLARATAMVSVPLHATISGTVVAIEMHPIPNASGLDAECIVIESDGKDTWCERKPHNDPGNLTPTELRHIIQDAGIVGLGGAGFPSHIKLAPEDHIVETLLLNGAECEPYISCDDMLMRHSPEQVIGGARIMSLALHARRCVIAVEDNKPLAYDALLTEAKKHTDCNIEILMVPTRYPTGGEKQLIHVVTGKIVPKGKLPLDVGVVCHNVATAHSVFHAVMYGDPLIERIVTVSGNAAREPQNLVVRLGTPIQELLEVAGGANRADYTLVMGGPMMGHRLRTTEAPVTKTFNCLLVTPPPQTLEVRQCIRCGECARVCPVSLMPQQLYWYAKAKDLETAQDYNLSECIECGCCSYVCPSNIPLVHYFRYAKSAITAQKREQQAADKARRRHEFRQFRLERDKAERAAKLRKKKEALAAKEKKSTTDESPSDPKKAAIEAALARSKAKKEEAAVKPKNVDNLTDEQKAKIAEIDARRTTQPNADTRDTPSSTEDS